MKRHIIGIDLGGTSLRLALASTQGKIIQTLSIPTEADKGKNHVISRIISSILSLIDSANVSKKSILKIGIGAPGPIIKNSGVISEAPNLKGWKNVPLKKILEKALKIPIELENDANAAALAESKFGAGKKLNSFIYITVSTGIGGGIIINRKILSGSLGAAGEIGHIIIDPNGPKGKCGQTGCLEALSSGTALSKRSKKVFSVKLTPKEIELLAKKGNKKALKLIDDTAKYLGIGIANLSNIIDPEAFIIGGGLSNMGDILLKPTRKYAALYSLPFKADRINILPAKFKKEAGLLGAVSLCLS